jgi:hypothetical protein
MALIKNRQQFLKLAHIQESTCKPAQKGLLLPVPNRIMLIEISPPLTCQNASNSHCWENSAFEA